MTLSDPVIIYYVGDLSVSLASTGQFHLDSCTKLVKAYYNVTVKNTNGNSKFSFDVEFFKNGMGTTFYYLDGRTKDNGRARIETLNINETRTISGYIQTPYVAPNTDISNAFELKGQITELLVQPINQPIYKIKTDLAPRNNVSTVQTTLPLFAFSKTVFDDLPITSMQSSGMVFGNQEKNPFPSQLPNYAPLATNPFGQTPNQIILGYNNEIGAVQFVKGGCLPVSGKPFYYMKSNGKYITYQLGWGLILLDVNQAPESTRRWVFTIAPQVTGMPGTTFFVYNMSLSANFRLQVRWSDELQANFIGLGTPDAANKQQVFSVY